MYGDTLNKIFADPYAAILAEEFVDPITISLADLSDKLAPSKIPTDMLTEAIKDDFINNPNSVVRVALKDNNLTEGWTPTTPMKLYHCDGDIHVDYKNATVALAAFQSRGATDIEIVSPVAGGTHVTCLVPSLLGAKDWFNSLVK